MWLLPFHSNCYTHIVRRCFCVLLFWSFGGRTASLVCTHMMIMVFVKFHFLPFWIINRQNVKIVCIRQIWNLPLFCINQIDLFFLQCECELFSLQMLLLKWTLVGLPLKMTEFPSKSTWNVEISWISSPQTSNIIKMRSSNYRQKRKK